MERIIPFDGKHYQEFDISLVSTHKAENPLLLNSGIRMGTKSLSYHPNQYFTQDYLLTIYSKSFHLHILSNDEIKKGDYYIFKTAVLRAEDNSIDNDYCKKIIATTDISLKYDTGKVSSSITCGDIPIYKSIPQIPKSFIEYYITEYNKGNIIKTVYVEVTDNGVVFNSNNEISTAQVVYD
jgi:hypothetical protein